MYLSKVTIDNYRGIKYLEVNFTSEINVIIGENGRCKSALIDALRLLYNIGEPLRDISVMREDFHETHAVDEQGHLIKTESDAIKLCYEFKGLSPEQQGAFYEYMIVDSADHANSYARVELVWKNDKKYPVFSYHTGGIEGQKADFNSFHQFQHYYLGALRDSTRDLSNLKNNILGKVIKRLVDRKQTEQEIREIIKDANTKLLARDEVSSVKNSINSNLDNIFKNSDRSQIGVHIEQSRIEYIVNVIKPYLPHDWKNNSLEGFRLWQNSLGFNNIIYIATVLGDIKERIADDPIPHFALFIEEPEAHIHPQLQLSLYNFLKQANHESKSQLFITTHSPTLTSRVPFENLILLESNAYTIADCFVDREKEEIIQDTAKKKKLLQVDIAHKKKQLERYVDVTKSQMFFAKGCLFVEGISEELLISAFCQLEGFFLEDYRIELVNVDGTSFYPFLFLFNSAAPEKRLPKKIAILTDDDRFTSSTSADYTLQTLVENNYAKLEELHQEFLKGKPANRIANLTAVTNNQSGIYLSPAYQTLELEICRSNVPSTKTELYQNLLYKYLKEVAPEITRVDGYLSTLQEDISLETDKVAILLWKCMPSKANFAQDFAIRILEDLSLSKTIFNVPEYIRKAFAHLQK